MQSPGASILVILNAGLLRKNSMTNNRHVLVLDATYRCNDHCDFCFNQKQVNREPHLSLAAIKQNYTYIRKKYPLEQIIISGGEPTLHPEFFELMEFAYKKTDVSISLNTNSLLCSQPAFLQRYDALLASIEPARLHASFFSLSLSNVDHFPPQTPAEKMKVQGIKHALTLAWRYGINTLIVIAVTKTNYKILPQLTTLITQHFQKSKKYNPKMSITLRGLYLDHYMTPTQKELTVPKKFQTIKPYVTKALQDLIREPRITTKLFNLPLCYFKHIKQLPELTLSLRPFALEMRAKLNHEKQLTKIRFTKFHGDTWDRPECHNCVLTSICNKIQPEFLTDYQYPPLQPF